MGDSAHYNKLCPMWLSNASLKWWLKLEERWHVVDTATGVRMGTCAEKCLHGPMKPHRRPLIKMVIPPRQKEAVATPLFLSQLYKLYHSNIQSLKKSYTYKGHKQKWLAGLPYLFLIFFICLFLDHSGFRFSFKVTTQAACTSRTPKRQKLPLQESEKSPHNSWCQWGEQIKAGVTLCDRMQGMQRHSMCFCCMQRRDAACGAAHGDNTHKPMRGVTLVQRGRFRHTVPQACCGGSGRSTLVWHPSRARAWYHHVQHRMRRKRMRSCRIPCILSHYAFSPHAAVKTHSVTPA